MLIIVKQGLCQRLNHKTDHNLYFQIIRLLIGGGYFVNVRRRKQVAVHQRAMCLHFGVVAW